MIFSKDRPECFFLVNGIRNLRSTERYNKGSAEVRKESGAKLIWSGKAQLMPIGPSEKAWDMVALVWYPNAQAYLTMKATEAYQAARGHRRASLHDSRLIMTTPN